MDVFGANGTSRLNPCGHICLQNSRTPTDMVMAVSRDGCGGLLNIYTTDFALEQRDTCVETRMTENGI
jgi:hypothetical protein